MLSSADTANARRRVLQTIGSPIGMPAPDEGTVPKQLHNGVGVEVVLLVATDGQCLPFAVFYVVLLLFRPHTRSGIGVGL